MFRVVFPDFLDRTPIPRGAGISDNNAVIRRVDFSQALEFDLDSHGCGLLPAISVRAVLCRVGTGDNARGGLRIREREREGLATRIVAVTLCQTPDGAA